ncbi:hypothetical protein BD626DRAFT_477677, partial [Schizophyllum amplum]
MAHLLPSSVLDGPSPNINHITTADADAATPTTGDDEDDVEGVAIEHDLVELEEEDQLACSTSSLPPTWLAQRMADLAVPRLSVEQFLQQQEALASKFHHDLIEEKDNLVRELSEAWGEARELQDRLDQQIKRNRRLLKILVRLCHVDLRRNS